MRDFLTTKEAAQLLGCSDGWVRQLIIAKRLTAQRLHNRQLMVDKQSVIEFKAKRQVKNA